jgi:hypothetical protein
MMTAAADQLLHLPTPYASAGSRRFSGSEYDLFLIISKRSSHLCKSDLLSLLIRDTVKQEEIL